MEVSKIFAWLGKIAFWITAALLAIGVYMTHSPWWLVGFGLLLLVSFRAVALCRMQSSAIIPLFLCDGYFLFAFGKIVSDRNSSAWWLIVALVLEVVIVGNAQNQVEEDEKKSKIARETEKRFAEEKKKAAQIIKEDDAGKKETKLVKTEVKRKRKTLGAKKTEIPKKISDISEKINSDDNFDKSKVDKIKNSFSHEEYIDEDVATICEAFERLTNQQLCCIVLNSGSSKNDITIATDLLAKRNALELLSQTKKQ